MTRKEPWEWALFAAFLAAIVAVIGLGATILLRPVWQFEARVVLAAEPEAVYPYLVEREKRASWQFGLLDIAPLTGKGDRPGDTALLFMSAEGKRWQIDETLDAYEPPHLWRATQQGPDYRTDIEIVLTRQADGTALVWRETRRYRGLFARLMAPLDLIENRKRLDAAFSRLAGFVAGA